MRQQAGLGDFLKSHMSGNGSQQEGGELDLQLHVFLVALHKLLSVHQGLLVQGHKLDVRRGQRLV